ncbi:uncharacterized protein METZ01_LOCUS365649, partial [marine metagenome]
MADVSGDLVRITDKWQAIRPGSLLQQLELVGAVNCLDSRRVPAEALRVYRQPFQPCFQLLGGAHGEGGVGAQGVPSVGQFRSAAHRRAALPADPDGRMGLLNWFRHEADIVET